MQKSQNSWLEPLIAPADLVAKATRTDERSTRVGLALLLDAELGLYANLAPKAGWPEFGKPAPQDAPADIQLLAAVARDLADGAGATSALHKLAASLEEAGISCAAAVLAAMSSARREDVGAARAVLSKRLASTEDLLERRLLLTHLGLYAAEDDDFDEAIARTREARGEGEPAAGYEHALWVVASHNLWRFELRMPPEQRTLDFAALPLRSGVPEITRAELLLADGLDKYLEAQFEGVLVNPYLRRTVWQRQDPVERGLFGALLRAECLADWNGLGVTRRALGRYRLLAGVGRSEEALAPAFDLLRRAGDDKGLGASARLIVRLGPLATLRDVTAAAVTARWTSLDTSARLALLVNAADLLTPDEAAAALDRVLEPNLFLRQIPPASKASAALLAGVPVERHAAAARQLLELAEKNPDALLLQSLPRVLAAVDWLKVEADAREAWLDYVRRHLGQGGDESLLAEAVAVYLAASEPAAISTAAAEAFAQRPALDTLAVFLEAGVELPTDVAERAFDLALESLRIIRERAERGEYGFGGLSVPLLLFYLLQSVDRADAWEALTDFVLDPAVGIGEKTRALEAMARPETNVDFTAANKLNPELRSLTGFVDELGASDDAFQASALRLALKLGAVAGPEVLAELLRLSSSDTAFARIQAALTLPAAAELIGGEVAMTLALRLTDDPHPDVRAHAARALASRFVAVDEPLATATHERLRELLRDPGSLAPQATIAGLYDGYRAGRPPPVDLIAIVGQLQREHPSQAVIAAATTLLAELAAFPPT